MIQAPFWERHPIVGEAYFFSRRFDEAAANLLASLDLVPGFPVTHRVLASCYARMGRLDDAGEIAKRLRAITPAVMEPGTRYRNPELRELFLSGLRLAASEASRHPPAVVAVLRPSYFPAESS